MSIWDECVHCDETADLVVWEEWVNYVEQGGLSLPKNEDRSCGDSQRQNVQEQMGIPSDFTEKF